MQTCNRPLGEILVLARQEAAAQAHYFLGVGHVLLAMLTDDRSPAAAHLRQQAISVPRAIANVRRYIGQGDGRHLWSGHPHTPRLDVILGIAHDLALESGRANDVTEADIWQAMCEEADSLALHVLRRMGAKL